MTYNTSKMKMKRPGAVLWKVNAEVHLPNLHTLTLGVINSSWHMTLCQNSNNTDSEMTLYEIVYGKSLLGEPEVIISIEFA